MTRRGRAQLVYGLMSSHEEYTSADIGRIMGTTNKTALGALLDLVDCGLLGSVVVPHHGVVGYKNVFYKRRDPITSKFNEEFLSGVDSVVNSWRMRLGQGRLF